MVQPLLRDQRRNARLPRQEELRDVTIRDFSGGWNVADSDLNLSAKYAKRFTNVHRAEDGGVDIRPGTKLFSDTNTYLDEIIHIEYFNGFLVCVGKNGKIVTVDSAAKIVLIWDDSWAATLPGSPSGWNGDLEFASSAIFNGSLVICNGVNKPLSINSSMSVTYLQDLATGSNANTPICKYVISTNRYLVMAGDPSNESLLYISGTDTTIFVGDADPNDAVNIELGSRVSVGSAEITGLGRFRTNIIVAFEDVLLPGTLGVFDSNDDHIPEFDDAIENHGSIAHKALQTIGEDMFFCDNAGVTSIERALFTGNVRAERFSDLIDPELQIDLDRVNKTSTLRNRVFSLYDSQSSNYMLFVPDNPAIEDIRKYKCYVLKKNRKLKIEAWAPWEDWDFRCGCRSVEKRIFLCTGTEIFLLGEKHATGRVDRNVVYERDFIGVEEMFTDDTSFTDGKGWTPIADIVDSGISIRFEWLLPWSDNGSRNKMKNSRYIGFDTEGSAKFTVEMFIDNQFEDRDYTGEPWLGLSPVNLFDDGTGWDIEQLSPALSMDFIGNDASGYGAGKFGANYGGGRQTGVPPLYAWVTKYKLYRLRIHGYASKRLKWNSIYLAYTEGSIRP